MSAQDRSDNTSAKADVQQGTVKVSFQPSGRQFNVVQSDTLFEIAAEAGVTVDTVCGGNGGCGKCKVQFEADPPAACSLDYMHLSGAEIGAGYRLSCQVTANKDMVVRVPESGDKATVQMLHHGVERDVELQPNIKKVFIPYQDVRSHEHEADWDRIRMKMPRKLRPVHIPLALLRQLPALSRLPEGLTLALAGRDVIGLEPGNTAHRQFGVAFDIGSTTIVGFLIDLSDGSEVTSASAVNRQSVYGDDVIGRLSRSQRNPEGLEKLHGMLIGQINTILAELSRSGDAGLDEIYEVTVVGNMAMHHFLLKLDSTFLGLAPYAPVIRESITVTASELGLSLGENIPVFVLPNIAGFVGSDTVAVMLAAETTISNSYRMAIDVGTNGEMALSNRRRIIACSAPAGPALEGARIKMGMRAAEGAIDHVKIDEDVKITVIGEVPPVGICGSALIDIVAELVNCGLMHHSGAFKRHDELEKEVNSALRERLIEAEKRKDTYFILARAVDTGAENDIIFSQADVRECQLAKGAIRAGTMMLIDAMGITDDDLEEVCLAGAFGNFIDAQNALRAGLTPQVGLGKIRPVGNAAGVGAKLALVSVVERRRAIRIAQKTEHIQLSGSPEFQKAFTHAMQFPN